MRDVPIARERKIGTKDFRGMVIHCPDWGRRSDGQIGGEREAGMSDSDNHVCDLNNQHKEKRMRYRLEQRVWEWDESWRGNAQEGD